MSFSVWRIFSRPRTLWQVIAIRRCGFYSRCSMRMIQLQIGLLMTTGCHFSTSCICLTSSLAKSTALLHTGIRYSHRYHIFTGITYSHRYQIFAQVSHIHTGITYSYRYHVFTEVLDIKWWEVPRYLKLSRLEAVLRKYFHFLSLGLEGYCLGLGLVLTVLRPRPWKTPEDWQDTSLMTHCHYQYMSLRLLYSVLKPCKKTYRIFWVKVLLDWKASLLQKF